MGRTEIERYSQFLGENCAIITIISVSELKSFAYLCEYCDFYYRYQQDLLVKSNAESHQISPSSFSLLI